MIEHHYVIFVQPDKTNLVLMDIAEAKAMVVSIAPFTLDPKAGQVVMINFTVEVESEEAGFAGLGWLEDTLGPNCIVY